MHPTVIANKPGVCPVCGMDLVRKANAGEEVKITEELARLIKSPNEVVVASTKTVRGEFKSMEISMDLNGIVSYDTRNIYTIPSRTSGRIEKVFLKYNFQAVVKGQKVAEVYSPELINAQRELIASCADCNATTRVLASAAVMPTAAFSCAGFNVK